MMPVVGSAEPFMARRDGGAAPAQAEAGTRPGALRWADAHLAIGVGDEDQHAGGRALGAGGERGELLAGDAFDPVALEHARRDARGARPGSRPGRR